MQRKEHKIDGRKTKTKVAEREPPEEHIFSHAKAAEKNEEINCRQNMSGISEAVFSV